MVVERAMLLTVEPCCLDDATSALGSYNIEVMAKFFRRWWVGRKGRGTITLWGKKPAPREQQEGLKNVDMVGLPFC